MTRARTRERREERQRQQRRQRQIGLVGGLVALVVIAAVVVILVNQPTEAPIPAEALDRYEGIPQAKTEAGYPILGNPEAPVTVVEYASFDCPHCQEFHESVGPVLANRARAGEITFTYVPIWGTGGIANGEGAANAAICAGEQDAFWPYHDALFTWQSVYANTAFAQNRLTSGIESLGLDRAAWEACLRSDLPDRVVMSRDEAAEEVVNFSGTPMVLINGAATVLDLEAINTAIDRALASGPLPVETTAEPEATAEATEAS